MNHNDNIEDNKHDDGMQLENVVRMNIAVAGEQQITTVLSTTTTGNHPVECNTGATSTTSTRTKTLPDGARIGDGSRIEEQLPDAAPENKNTCGGSACPLDAAVGVVDAASWSKAPTTTTTTTARLMEMKTLHTGTRTAEIVDLLLQHGCNDTEHYLEWKKEFTGWTGYIDSVHARDVSRPVMWGIDDCKRPFVTIRTRVNDAPDLGVETFFKRYSDGNRWASGCHGNHPGNAIAPGHQVGDAEMKHLRELLLQGSTVMRPALCGEDEPYRLILC